MSNNLPIKVGGFYYVACHKNGFGPYFIVVEILSISKKQAQYNNYCDFQIFVHKHHDPYYESLTSQFGPWKRKVYLWEVQHHMKDRFIPLSQEDINALQETSV